MSFRFRRGLLQISTHCFFKYKVHVQVRSVQVTFPVPWPVCRNEDVTRVSPVLPGHQGKSGSSWSKDCCPARPGKRMKTQPT